MKESADLSVRYQESLVTQQYGSDQAHDVLDDDDYLDALDDREAFEGYREQRKKELGELMTRARRNVTSKGYGVVTHLESDKQIMDATQEATKVIVHFSHPDFARCKTMDSKLTSLAARHTDTRFLQVHAVDAPFLVTKLSIRVLPCVMAFVNGQERAKLVGFEGLGGSEVDFPLSSLEAYFIARGVLSGASGASNRAPKGVLNFPAAREESDDEDWD